MRLLQVNSLSFGVQIIVRYISPSILIYLSKFNFDINVKKVIFFLNLVILRKCHLNISFGKKNCKKIKIKIEREQTKSKKNLIYFTLGKKKA